MKLHPSTILFGAVTILVLGVGIWLNRGKDITPPAPPYPSVNMNGDRIMAVFEGRTPCVGCDQEEKVKIALVLYGDSQTNAPTTYWLGRVLVGNQEGAGQRVETMGTLKMRRGVQSYPGAIVYELDTNSPEEFRLYWRLNEDILLPLDQNMVPKVGNASWGYMLSRIQ